MQLPGIIAFLLLLNYEVSSRHNGRFGEELELLQDSLVERIYEDTALDPEDDDDEIEEIANAILQEAERRLKKRELSKKHDDNDDSKQEYKADETKSHVDSHSDRRKSYKDAVSHAYKDVVNRFNNDVSEEKDERKNKREVSEDQSKQNTILHKKQINKFKKSIKLNTKSKRNSADQVEVSHADNNQIATVKVDNAPDQQSKLANNPQSGKTLFLETNTKDNKEKNKSILYAGKDHKSPPPQRVVTNKVDRRGLDQFSFIAIIVGCCVAGVAGIGLVSFCWYKLRTETKDIKNGSPNGSFKSNSLRGSDRKKKTSDEDKLTQGAEVFHYLHAKKQMQQMEEPNLKSDHCSINDSSDDEEEGEDTVYECPGLAPPGDMKVVNPLFSDTESHYSDPPSLHSTPTPPSEEINK